MCCPAELAAYKRHVNHLARMTNAERREWAKAKEHLDAWQFPVPSPDTRVFCTTASSPSTPTSEPVLDPLNTSSSARDFLDVPGPRQCRPLTIPNPPEQDCSLCKSSHTETARTDSLQHELGPFDDRISWPPEKWWWTDQPASNPGSVKSTRRRRALTWALGKTCRSSRETARDEQEGNNKDDAEEEHDGTTGEEQSAADETTRGSRGVRRLRNVAVRCRNVYGFYVRAPQRVPWQSPVLTRGQRMVQRLIHYEEPAGARERITV